MRLTFLCPVRSGSNFKLNSFHSRTLSEREQGDGEIVHCALTHRKMKKAYPQRSHSAQRMTCFGKIEGRCEWSSRQGVVLKGTGVQSDYPPQKACDKY